MSDTDTTAPLGVDIRPMLSPQDVAAICNVPLDTVRTWRKRGGGPVFLRVGRHLRCPAKDFEEWLDSLRASETAPGHGRGWDGGWA